MSPLIHLDVHGVVVEIEGETAHSEAVLEALREDFEFFAKTGPSAAEERAIEASPSSIRVVLEGKAWPGDPPRGSLPVFRTKLCQVRELGWGRRWCGYGNGNAVVATAASRFSVKSSGREFRIFAAAGAVAYELAYLALLSAIGEQLDLRGFHRVHALGIERGGKAALALLPRGGGKSAMALLGAERGDFRVYSDENPLVRDGLLYPYPVRAALAPEVAEALGIRRPSRVFRRLAYPEKRLFRWEPDWVAREPRAIDRIFVGRIEAGAPSLRSISPLRALPALSEYLLVGSGLAQMAEHMLRADAAAGLARIASSRAREVLVLARAARFERFDVGRDAKANLVVLAEGLGR